MLTRYKYPALLLCIIATTLQAQSVDRFMVFADPHYYSPQPGFQKSILFELISAGIEEKANFIFIAGDLIIQNVTENSQIDSVVADWRFILDTLAQHDIRMYAVRGNNDVFSGAVWDSVFSGIYAFPQNGPPDEMNRTYAVVYDNLLFLAFDQYVNTHKINQTWLDSTLTLYARPHIMAAGHEPAFKLIHTNCLGVFPRKRDLFWQSMTGAGAKIYFCGHDHCYDHAVLDDGDSNPGNDIHQVIVGTGGAYPHGDALYDGDNGQWTPVRSFHAADTGYVLAEVNTGGIKMSWKQRAGPKKYVDGGDVYYFLSSSLRTDHPISDINLKQNYPNPFNSSTTIEFTLPKSGYAELKVFDILGKEVSTLVSGKLNQGNHTCTFDGKNLASGIYYYQLVTGDPSTGLSRAASRGSGQHYREVKKMILLR